MGSDGSKPTKTLGKAWAWRKRREIHEEAKKLCMRALTTEEGMPWPQPMNHNRLYTHFFELAGRTLKVRPAGNQEAWWFAEWRNDAGEWYVCILALKGHTLNSALLDLCEVLAEVQLGFRKPSLVRRKNSSSE